VGVKGPVTLSSTSGSLSVKDLTGPVKAETESGNIFGICYSSSPGFKKVVTPLISTPGGLRT